MTRLFLFIACTPSTSVSLVACGVSTPITCSQVSLTLTYFPMALSYPSKLTLVVSPSTQTGADAVFSSSVKKRPCTRDRKHTSELQSLRHLVCRLLLENTK